MFTLSFWRYLAFSLHTLSLKFSGFLFENSSVKEDKQRSALLNVLNVMLSTTCLLIGKICQKLTFGAMMTNTKYHSVKICY